MLWLLFVVWVAALHFFAIGFTVVLWRMRGTPRSRLGMLVYVIFTATLWYYALGDDAFIARKIFTRAAGG